MENHLFNLAETLGKLSHQKHTILVTAESCTGGQLAFLLTSIPGSSQWFERGFVTYSNEAKAENLNVSPECLKQFGAVSEETAKAMAAGALLRSNATLAVATTGIAGPGGGSLIKPVGTVWIAWATKHRVYAKHYLLTGDRLLIRDKTCQHAFEEMIAILQKN